MKLCRDCGETKSAPEFSPEKHKSPDGLRSYCKACAAARSRAYRDAKRTGVPAPRKPKQTPEVGSVDWGWRRRHAHRVTSARQQAKRFGDEVNDLHLSDWLWLMEMHDGKCYYCSSEDDIQIEHVVPLSTGGPNTRSNVVPACRDCNWRKRLKPVDRFLANQCGRGHDMSFENTYVYPDGKKTACKECRRDAQRRCDARRRAKAR